MTNSRVFRPWVSSLPVSRIRPQPPLNLSCVVTHADAFTRIILIKYFDKFLVFDTLRLYVNFYFIQMCVFFFFSSISSLNERRRFSGLFISRTNARSLEMSRSFISRRFAFVRSQTTAEHDWSNGRTPGMGSSSILLTNPWMTSNNQVSFFRIRVFSRIQYS